MATVPFIKFQRFVEAVAHGKHNLSTAQIKVALTNVLPVAASAGVLADITEIAYTYCSSRSVTTSASAQTGGTYKLTCAGPNVLYCVVEPFAHKLTRAGAYVLYR